MITSMLILLLLSRQWEEATPSMHETICCARYFLITIIGSGTNFQSICFTRSRRLSFTLMVDNVFVSSGELLLADLTDLFNLHRIAIIYLAQLLLLLLTGKDLNFL